MQYVMNIYVSAVQFFQFLILSYFISVFYKMKDMGRLHGTYVFTVIMFLARAAFSYVPMLGVSQQFYTPFMMVVMGIALYICYQMNLLQIIGMVFAYIGICVVPTLLAQLCANAIPYIPKDALGEWGHSPEIVIIISIMDMIINLVYVAVLVVYYLLKKSLRLPDRFSFFLIFLYQVLIFFIYFEKCMVYHPSLLVTGMFMVVLTSLMDLMVIAGMRARLEQGEMEAATSKIYEQRSYELQYYRILDEQKEQLQQVQRDFSKRLEELSRTADENKETLIGLMNETSQRLAQYRVRQYCQNQTINSVIYVKKKKADEAGIPMEISMHLPEQIGIEALDLCSVFCNLLDNAIEACEKISGERYIRLMAEMHAGYLLITETNPMSGTLSKKNGRILSSKADRSLHGYGLELIKAISRKYEGKVEIGEKDGEYRILVIVKPQTGR